jgi:hypothetical protein
LRWGIGALCRASLKDLASITEVLKERTIDVVEERHGTAFTAHFSRARPDRDRKDATTLKLVNEAMFRAAARAPLYEAKTVGEVAFEPKEFCPNCTGRTRA